MIQVVIGNMAEVRRMLDLIDSHIYERVILPTLNETVHLGQFEAVNRAPVLMGILRASIRPDSPENIGSSGSIVLAANAPHAVFQEMGFRPHFVPFHLSNEMQVFARKYLGWQVAIAPESKRASGRVYMKDAEGNLHWGLQVSGRSQPFMRPAAIVMQEAFGPILAKHMRRGLGAVA